MKAYAQPRSWFDWAFIAGALWWTAGAFVDGWAHNHLGSTLETFFTPWHAVFYSGILFTTLLLISELLLNHRKGYLFRRALPKEYMFSLFGIAITLAAGMGDMIWHRLFGIEVGVEALLSPTHILLAIGGAITVSGPFHSLWHRDRNRSIPSPIIILSAACFISVIYFMLQFLNPFNFPWMAESFFIQNPTNPNYAAGLGIANIIVFTGIFCGLIFSTMRYWRLPYGSFTTLLTLNVLAITLMHGAYYAFIIAAFLAGIMIDILYRKIIASMKEKERYIRLFSFLMPVIIFSWYFIVLGITDKITWSVHMWTGAIVIAGIVGFLMSYPIIPPHDSRLHEHI